MNNRPTANSQEADPKTELSHEESSFAVNGIKQYAAFFDMLDQIDRRLIQEDTQYKKKYMKGMHDQCSKTT